MKLIIDDKVCKKHKMSLAEALVTYIIRMGVDGNDIKEMLDKEILVEGDGPTLWYQVTQRWSDVLDEILCDSEVTPNDKRLEILAEKIRERFPPGFKVDDRSGTKYYHKSNKKAITQALKRFIVYYGDYSDEEILDATQRYIDSFQGNYVPPFQMANYFVVKDLRNKGGDITSSLATFLENKEEGEGENNNSDWTTKLI